MRYFANTTEKYLSKHSQTDKDMIKNKIPFCQNEAAILHDRNFPHNAEFSKLLGVLLP